MQRDTVLLASSWAMTLTASTLMTSAGPLAAKSAGAGNALAPFTVGAFLLGAALVSGPSDVMFERWGRRGGFVFGCLVGGLGGAVGAFALEFGGGKRKVWPFIIVACFLIGVSQGVGQFLRFAASELWDREADRARAVTYCLSGGVVAAFAGPTAAVHSRTLGPIFTVTFSGCFALVIVVNALNLLFIMGVRFKDVTKPRKNAAQKQIAFALLTTHSSHDYSSPQNDDDDDSDDESGEKNDETTQKKIAPPLKKKEEDEDYYQKGSRGGSLSLLVEEGEEEGDNEEEVPRRRALEILSTSRCACAVAVASLAHTSMVMLMSCLTLAMHDRGFSFKVTCLTMELHFLSMYLPGLLGASAFIRKAGPYLASVAGLAIYALSALILATRQSLLGFISGMVFCGIAWNLCFSSATVLLTTCYTSQEALMVQAINDLIIFGLAGSGSFVSGYIYDALGWLNLIFIVAVFMALFAIVLAYSLLIDNNNKQKEITPLLETTDLTDDRLPIVLLTTEKQQDREQLNLASSHDETTTTS